MATFTPRLDTLPTEIQQRIISFGSFETLLRLTLVNRAFHRACDSNTIIKAIIDNRHGLGGPVWKYPHLSIESTAAEWARYALADFMACKCLGELPMGVIFRTSMRKQVFHWAPQLMALHHPILNDEIELSRRLGFDSFLHAEYWMPSFCVLLESISNKIPINSILQSDQPSAHDVNAGTALYRYHIRPELQNWLYLDFLGPNSHEVRDKPDASSLSSMRLKADMAIAILAMCLRHEVRAGNITAPWSGIIQNTDYEVGRIVPAPTAFDIPFHTMMDLPPPFDSKAAEKFASSHLARMATPEFIEDGEWVGYYSAFAGRITKPPKFDPPMHSVRFSALRSSTLPNETLSLTGEGKDGVGPFHLCGSLSVATGCLRMDKKYQNAPIHWVWRGILTPYGIVANWGYSNGGGWVWLWKASWTNSNAS